MPDNSSKITVAVDQLNSIVEKSLAAIGVPESDIATVRDVLMYAELRGNNQGLIKIVGRNVVPDPDARPIEITRRMPCAALVRGNGNVAMAVVKRAAEEACDLAKTQGIGIVGTSHTSSSTGAIGYYANYVAKQNLVGINMAGSPKVVAIAGGIDPVFGTNPIAIGMPGSDGPVVLDMATAAIAWFGLIQADNRKESIPGDVAFDQDGNATTIPAAALKGAIRTFGGIKGSGLALMVELLTGPLLGASIFGDKDAGKNNGNLIIAIDPNAFGDPKNFICKVDTLFERVKAGRLAAGCEQILLPGERGNAEAQSNLEKNSIRIDRELYEQLTQLAQT